MLLMMLPSYASKKEMWLLKKAADTELGKRTSDAQDELDIVGCKEGYTEAMKTGVFFRRCGFAPQYI